MTQDIDSGFFLAPGLIKKSFNRAAQRYNQHAHVQKKVLSQLLERLDFIRLDCACALDLGSGTGAALKGLHKRFSGAQIVASDLAFNMLKGSRKKRFFLRRNKLIAACADARHLPFAGASFDLVFSNLMLQWCSDLGRVLTEIRSVLKPGGLLVFSLFGFGTLRELAQSWRAVDERIHVNAFYDIHDVGTLVTQAGLSDAVLDTETMLNYYPDCMCLMNNLKQLGAHNIAYGRRKTLTGKQRLLGMIRAYEKERTEEGLPVSYEVIYGHAWKDPGALPLRKEKNTIPLTAVARSLRKAK